MQEIYNDSTDQEVYFDAVDVSGEFAVRLVGSSDGELMTGATVAVKEYKVATASISSPVISWVQALGKWKLVVPVANVTQYGYGLIFITKDGIAPVTIEFKTVHDDAYFAGAGAISALELKVDGVGYSVSDAMVEIGEVKTVSDGIATALETPDNFKADISNLATSAEITALSNIAAVGAEKIVPADKYVFDASAKTLTFSSPYDTLTVEQVTFIKNLTTNYIIWDCRYAGYQTLPIRFGAAPNTHVLSFDSSDSDAANTDKIMIVVNQV